MIIYQKKKEKIMSTEVMISIICIGSASMSILFLFSVTKEIKVTPDKIKKIFRFKAWNILRSSILESSKWLRILDSNQ